MEGLLSSLPRLRDFKTRRLSSYDRTGGNADYIVVAPGETAVIADIQATGIIKHIWFTHDAADPMIRRNLIFRAYWDGETTPSIESPLGDFFGQGWGESYNFASLPLAAAPDKGRGLNSYFPMPFAESAKLTVENQSTDPVRHLYFIVDYAGHDIFTQIVRGTRSVMVVGALAALISTTIAITFGALAAILGGRFDSVALLLTDVVLTIPYIVLLGVLATFVKLNSPIFLAFIIAAVTWPTLLRAVRAQVLSLKEREYIEAARILDLGTVHILFREVLPNMTSYIVINFVIAMTNAIYGQIILYFFGLVPLSGDNWGLMIQLGYTKGAIFFNNSLWYILSPIVAIALLQLSLVMIARSLEEIFNPRLREG